MEYIYQEDYSIKTPEFGIISDEFYGDPQYLPTRMRGYKRFRGLEYHEFETLIQLKGKKYAERIRNYIVSDPKYKDEILFNKKIDRLLLGIKGSEFSFLIEHYEYYYHPKFMKFILNLNTGSAYLKTSTIGDYLIHILTYIFQSLKKRRMTNIELDSLKNRLGINAKEYFKRKIELVDNQIIQNVYFNNAENEYLIAIERAGFYVQKFSEVYDIDISYLYKKLKSTYYRYDLGKYGHQFRAEILFTFSLIDSWAYKEILKLRKLAEFMGLQDVDIGRFTKKFYKLKSLHPNLKDAYANFIFVEDLDLLTPVDQDIFEYELTSVNEDISYINQGTLEVIRKEETNERIQVEDKFLEHSHEFNSYPDEHTSLEFQSELKVPSQSFIQLAINWVKRRGAKVIVSDALWDQFAKQLSSYEFSILNDARIDDYQNDCPAIFLDNAVDSDYPCLRYKHVDLHYETITLWNYENFVPSVDGTILEQQANYLLNYARSFLRTDKVIMVSKILTHNKISWIAWTTFGPKILGEHHPYHTSRNGKLDIYFGDHGARILSAMKSVADKNRLVLWFGNYQSLYSHFISIGYPSHNIEEKIRNQNIVLVPQKYFSSLEKLSLFLKYQMPALPEGTYLQFMDLTTLFLKYYISDDLLNLSPHEIQEKIYPSRFNEFEADFIERYGQDYRMIMLKERVDTLGYLPSIIEKAVMLEEVEKEIDELWNAELNSFHLDIWAEVTKIYNNIQGGNYRAVDSTFSSSVVNKFLELLGTIREVTNFGGYETNIHLHFFGSFKLNGNDLKFSEESEISYQRELDQVSKKIAYQLKQDWDIHFTDYLSGSLVDNQIKNKKWSQRIYDIKEESPQ